MVPMVTGRRADLTGCGGGRRQPDGVPERTEARYLKLVADGFERPGGIRRFALLGLDAADTTLAVAHRGERPGRVEVQVRRK
jgi:hypothetical protein